MPPSSPGRSSSRAGSVILSPADVAYLDMKYADDPQNALGRRSARTGRRARRRSRRRTSGSRRRSCPASTRTTSSASRRRSGPRRSGRSRMSSSWCSRASRASPRSRGRPRPRSEAPATPRRSSAASPLRAAPRRDRRHLPPGARGALGRVTSRPCPRRPPVTRPTPVNARPSPARRPPDDPRTDASSLAFARGFQQDASVGVAVAVGGGRRGRRGSARRVRARRAACGVRLLDAARGESADEALLDDHEEHHDGDDRDDRDAEHVVPDWSRTGRRTS